MVSFFVRIGLLFLITCCTVLTGFSQYRVSDVPHPKSFDKHLFVSNPDGILRAETVADINRIAQRLDSLTGVEYAVVVLDDFEGDDVFNFALELFNTWGIGKKGGDNGLLLFIAKDRREYRFISGYGVEGVLPDAYLKRVGEQFLVPNFRMEDYDSGVFEASDAIGKSLSSPDAQAELDRMMPDSIPFLSWKSLVFRNTVAVALFALLAYGWIGLIKKWNSGPFEKNKKNKQMHPVFSGCGCMLMLMFFSIFIFAFVFNNVEVIYQAKNMPYFLLILGSLIVAMKYHKDKDELMASYKDEANMQRALRNFTWLNLIPMLIAPIAWYDFLKSTARVSQMSARFKAPDDSGNWIRINRDDRSVKSPNYLSKGQLKEESLMSRTYEIWINELTKERKILAWRGIAKKYKDCPNCHHLTYDLNLKKVITNSTYSSSGTGMRYNECKNCKHREELGTYVIPRKVRSSSSGGGSSSSGRSSSGGSSSSSGGGSFGGGSSGGGGAGGRW